MVGGLQDAGCCDVHTRGRRVTEDSVCEHGRRDVGATHESGDLLRVEGKVPGARSADCLPVSA